MSGCVDFNNRESHNITVAKIQYPLSCRERCEYPGMPCGLKANVRYPPCAEEIFELKRSLTTVIQRIHPNVTVFDVKAIFPGLCSSHPPRGTIYHTDLVLNKDGTEIPLGFIEEGIFRSE